jgi:hypothetical protein
MWLAATCFSRLLQYLNFVAVKRLLGKLLVRSQAKDSRKAMVEQSEFDEELSEQEDRLLL